MWRNKRPLAFLVMSLVLTNGASAAPGTDVSVNGKRLSTTEIRALERDIGSYVAPGDYLYDAGSGCWYNQTSGASGCLSANGSYTSRYGSGHNNAGSWNHWSNAAGGGVGGTADGCVYTTFGWSNC
jgi:hypothetical protein